MPKVSIVVRSMNDIQYIEETLTMIQKQSFKDFEMINVDSGSTDGTYEVVKKFNPEKSYQIKPEEYIPGKVLNDAINKSTGEIIVFNNSDCIPQNAEWLKNLIAPFHDNNNIVAVYGNQITRPDASPLVVKDGKRAFGDGTIAATWEHFFSLATSAARADILKKLPFDPDIQYSEDVEWSYRMKKEGYEIKYASDAIVEHSHNYTLKQVIKRFYNEGLADGKIYGTQIEFLKGFLLPCLVEMLRDIVYLTQQFKIFSIPYGLIYRFLQKKSVYRGRKAYFRNN